jgi:hypothetical protein
MNEDEVNIEEQEEDAWQPPPLPEEIVKEEKEPPEMSEVATLGNIFIEPGRTFEDLRRKPRFIIATLIICLLSTAFLFAFQQKMGQERYDRFFSAQIEKSPQAASLDAAGKEQAISLNRTIMKVVTFALPIFILISIAIGALLYWLGVKAMGGTISFFQSVSVWVYSSFPPAIVSVVANFVILFLKSPDDIDIAASQRGLVKANPSALIGGVDMPVLTTLISTLDIFAIWGIILAVIGLHKVGKISKGSAFGIVLILVLLGIAYRVISALFSGVPT